MSSQEKFSQSTSSPGEILRTENPENIGFRLSTSLRPERRVWLSCYQRQCEGASYCLAALYLIKIWLLSLKNGHVECWSVCILGSRLCFCAFSNLLYFRYVKLEEVGMNKRFFTKMIALMAIGVFSIAGPVSADTSKLIGSLVDTLGVSGEQATGGAGAIFKFTHFQSPPGWRPGRQGIFTSGWFHRFSGRDGRPGRQFQQTWLIT